MATELRNSGQRRTWRKVTTLLSMFGVARLTPTIRQRIEEALEQAGLIAEPPIAVVNRSQTVRLTLVSGCPDPSPVPPDGLDDPTARNLGVARVTVWEPGEFPREIRLAEAARANGLLWIEIDPAVAETGTLIEELLPVCGPELTFDQLADLLVADEEPRVRRYGGDGSVCFVSATRAEAQELEEDTGGIAGQLTFELVELLASRKWLLSCWHNRKIYYGGEQMGEDSQVARDTVFGSVAARWPEAHGRTVGDLGILILNELARTYEQPARELSSWLEQWELLFYRAPTIELTALTELRGLSASSGDASLQSTSAGQKRAAAGSWTERSTSLHRRPTASSTKH